MLGTIAWRKKKNLHLDMFYQFFDHDDLSFDRRSVADCEPQRQQPVESWRWHRTLRERLEINQPTLVCVWVWVFGLFGHLRNLHGRRRNVCPTGGRRRGMDSRFRDESVGALFRKVQLAVMTYELLRHGSGAWRARWVWLNCEMGLKIYLKTMGTTS